MKVIRSIFRGVKDYYISNIEADCRKRTESPGKMLFLDSFKAVSMILVVIVIFMVMTPAFQSMVDYAIENYTTYNTRLDSLTKQVNNAKRDMIDSALRTIKQFQNPSFDGIRFTNVNNVISVYPISCSIVEKKVYYLLTKWAREEGYDGLIFGESYSGLNGTFYWSDGKDEKYDTDMELIINMLKKKGCENIFSFVSNPEYKNYIPHVSNYIDGLFIISDVQNYRLEIMSHKFWKTHRSTIIRSENFSGEIINENLAVASRPKGNKNRIVIYSPKKNNFIQNIKDKSLNAILSYKKVKAVMNMADVIDKQ